MRTLSPRRALYLVLVVTGALYLTLLFAPALTWDDDANIFANPFFFAGAWSELWRHPYYGLYVPVTSTLWGGVFALGGGQVWPFRVLNGALHLANVALVYALINRARRGWPAVVGAALFALHPLQTAVVAWISGGRDLLATLYALTTCLLFVNGRRAPALATFALALLSKPNVVTLPLVGLILLPREQRRGAVPWAAAALGLAGLVAWLTFGAQAGHLPEVSWWQRPWLMGDAYWFYLTRLSGLATLAANYARTPDQVFARSVGLVTAVIPYLLLTYGLIRRPRWGRWAAAAALTLLPVSGLVGFGYQETSGVADHYAYPALAIVAGLTAELAARFGPRGRRSRGLAAGALVAVLALFTVRSFDRLRVWRSNDAFFLDMTRSAPRAYSTGIGMSNVACGERRAFDEGLRWAEVALAARPRDVKALANQAYCLLHAGRYGEVAALDDVLEHMDLERLKSTEPTGYASFLASIGTALIATEEFSVGYAYLCEAARVMPGEAIHQRNLVAGAKILREHRIEPDCDAD